MGEEREVRKFRKRFAAVADDCGKRCPGVNAVPRGQKIAQDDVSGLFAAQRETFAAHTRGHIVVAYIRAHERNAGLFQCGFRAQIGVKGAHDRGSRQTSAAEQGTREHIQDPVPVDDASLFVARDDAVRVPVERKPQIRSAADGFRRGFVGVQCAAPAVDAFSVVESEHRRYRRAASGEYLRSKPPGGAVGAVEHDVQSVQPSRPPAYGVDVAFGKSL